MMLRVGTVAVERRKLYQQIWSVPASQLAVLYGISDVGLAKTCKRYNIPRPPRGYWARIASGQRIRKPSLPRSDRVDELVYIKGWEMPDDAVQKLIDDNRTPPAAPRAAGAESLHPLAATTREQLLSIKPNSEGLLASAAPAMDVRVSPARVERCAVVLNTLIKRWESRGGSVLLTETADDLSPQTAFAMGADSFSVRLAENVDESKPLTDPTRLTGNLALHITGKENRQFRRRWSDTKSQRLERMLGPFVETLINALAVERRERLDAECVARQRKRIEEIRKATNRDASREFYWRQELMQHVGRWQDAQRVRAYLAALRAAIDAGRWQPADEQQFATWLDWATRFADSIDPIVRGSLPEGKPPDRQNVSATELDLTATTRAVIDTLAVADSDALWKQKKDVIREASNGKFGPVWNEITRVLDGLGYDVSKRENASEWA